MSTPLGHNAILAASVKEALDDYNCIWKLPESEIKEAFYQIMSVITGYYNYPDATQAIHRSDGNLLSRRVTHFETAKDNTSDSNTHTPFTVSFLRTVKESDLVKDFWDTDDQQGNVMGQMSDFICIDQEFANHLSGSKGIDNYMLAKFAMAHLKGVDRLNDLLFRRFITENYDGSLTIDSVTYTPEEKKEVFGPIKALIMNSQEQLAQLYLSQTFPDCDYARLNEAITESYNFAYSPWLASNTLKFVKPICNVVLNSSSSSICEPINDSYQKLGLNEKDFHDIILDFVRESVQITKPMVQDIFFTDFYTTMQMFEF